MKTYWEAYLDDVDCKFLYSRSLCAILEDFWDYCHENGEWCKKHGVNKEDGN